MARLLLFFVKLLSSLYYKIRAKLVRFRDDLLIIHPFFLKTKQNNHFFQLFIAIKRIVS